jgi:hypothetical protein
MTRNFELDIFNVIARRQQLFIKICALSLSVAALFFVLSFVVGWPLFFSIIPIALTGPFVLSVATARCPHCQRQVHRSPLAILRPLKHCARCGFPK